MPRKLYPYATLALLTAINLLNYVDRNILFAVQPLVQKEFHGSDAEFGLLTSAFFFSYMIAAPFLGRLADRSSRKLIVVAGIMVWSGFTLLTAITHNYAELLMRHTVVGIGEASYAAIAPTLIADLFPEHRRGRMLAIFYLGLPVGSAAGYLVGGLGAQHFGWRAPFLLSGPPGFLLALLLWLLPEPERGSSDTLQPSLDRSTVGGLFRNPAYLTATLGLAMFTFAAGGLQVWMPTFLSRMRGVPLDRANLIFGGITAFNGIVATLAGGWLGDRLLKRTAGAYYLVSGLGLALAIPWIAVVIYRAGPLMLPGIFLSEFFLLLNTGPLNAAVINAVDARIRATAIALNLFVIHLLGDAFSPTLIGYVSDRTGSLAAGFSTALVAVLLSALLLFYGMRFAPRLNLARLEGRAGGGQ